jgi:hypothetical protein
VNKSAYIFALCATIGPVTLQGIAGWIASRDVIVGCDRWVVQRFLKKGKRATLAPQILSSNRICTRIMRG